jgi:hypothetical protein
MKGEQTSIPGAEDGPPASEPIMTGLAARLRKGDAEWVIRMANHHKMPVPRLAGLLIENAIAACRQTPALIGEILQTEDAR